MKNKGQGPYYWSLPILLALVTVLGSCAGGAPLLPENLRAAGAESIRTGIDLDSVYFHSRDELSRSPVGAVEVGSTVEFRVSTRRGNVRSIELVILDKFIEGNQDSLAYLDFDRVPMAVESTDGEQDSWAVSYTFEYLGTYGYYFVLDRGGRDQVNLGNNANSVRVPWVDVSGTGGLGRFSQGEVRPFNQTVYSPDIDLGPEAENHIIYYIFPDRFKNGSRANDPVPGETRFYNDLTVEFHENWSDPWPWRPGDADSDEHWNNDFYGGDLEGIIQKLDHIASLGTTLIYMTPIFQAPSNHKYDTADYMTIDPHFGDLPTFQRLVREARARGMGIVLDASLNHSGSDSVYMDRYGKFPGIGAFEDETIRQDSPYYDWYRFTPGNDPDRAYVQWANPTLAEIQEVDSFKDFAFRDQDSVMRFWLRQGAVGWRMDVTPWVSDEFWREWRTSIRQEFPQALTYSEVWFDASKYLLGDMYDSTMNYIFRGTAIHFGRGLDANMTREGLEMLQENYPRPAFYRAMNLLSSHDVPRIFHELGYRQYGHANYPEIRSRFVLTSALQFTIPGAPTIFYGDEVAITGGDDPLTRGPFPWPEDGVDRGDWTLVEDLQALGQLRREYPQVFGTGDFRFLYSDSNLLVFERRLAADAAPEDGTGPDTQGPSRALVVLNNSLQTQPWPGVDLGELPEGPAVFARAHGQEASFEARAGESLPPLAALVWIQD